MSITYRGERFSGYNKPKRTPNKSKKFAVLAKKGDKVKLVRFGDPKMTIKKDQPARRKSFRARHKCDTKLTNLISLWQVRVKIVFSLKNRMFVNSKI